MRITAPLAWAEYLGTRPCDLRAEDFCIEPYEWLCDVDLLNSIFRQVGDVWFGLWGEKGMPLTEYEEIKDE